MTQYLVTGGAGFIGSHVVETLLKRGKRVRVLDNFFTGKRENLEAVRGHVELIEGDADGFEAVVPSDLQDQAQDRRVQVHMVVGVDMIQVKPGLHERLELRANLRFQLPTHAGPKEKVQTGTDKTA